MELGQSISWKCHHVGHNDEWKYSVCDLSNFEGNGKSCFLIFRIIKYLNSEILWTVILTDKIDI